MSVRWSVRSPADPLWVGEFDLADPRPLGPGPTPTVGGRPYTGARILIRFRGEPLGHLTVGLLDGAVDHEALRTSASERFASAVAAIEPTWDRATPPSPELSPELRAMTDRDLPAISVVIGTRNRPHLVVDCIARILKQDYPSPVEVIVVENGVRNTSTEDAVEASFGRDDRVRYMAESRPGLSRARNLGLAAARYPVTAFLSDDIRVDPLWLVSIARGFARHAEVTCVAGICPPLYLESPEQLWFESIMAWGSRQGFTPQVVGYHDPDDPLHPYRPGSFANGSNMACDTEAFRRIGGFDEALGPGTMARGGEDLDAPIRILAAGGRVAVEPAAIGWHADRYEGRKFESLMFTYGMGLTAFLAKHAIDPGHRSSLLRRVPKGFGLLLKTSVEPDEDLERRVSISLRYHLCHLAGRLAGPVAYLRSRWARHPV